MAQRAPTCAILLPAAGSSRRMRGADKLLMPLHGGVPILHHVARIATTVSCHVAVTLRPDDAARQAALDGLGLERLSVAQAQEGMAASLRAGAAWALQQPVSALMIALPDMPDVTQADFCALIAAQTLHPDQPLRAASHKMQPGHPVILPRALLPELLHLSGDRGAASVLKVHPPRLHALPDKRALCDLDSPEDWESWRAGQGI